MDRVTFLQEDGKEQELFVLAEAKVGQVSYLLCTEEEEGDADAFVLKAVSEDGQDEEEEMMTYESVTDDGELRKAVEALEAVLDDIEIEL